MIWSRIKGRSGMHADGAGSGTHPFPGPLGRDSEVLSAKIAAVGGECATGTFDSGGRLVTVCGTFSGFLLKLFDPRTLDTLAEYKLPQRSSTVEGITRLDFEKTFQKSSPLNALTCTNSRLRRAELRLCSFQGLS